MRRAGPQNQACDGSWTADSHQGRKVEGGKKNLRQKMVSSGTKRKEAVMGKTGVTKGFKRDRTKKIIK